MALDIDDIRVRLGQWDQLEESKGIARDLGFGLAVRHLSLGHDVVLPQLLLNPEVFGQLDDLATDNGARFVEVLLIAQRDELVARLEHAETGAHPRNLFTPDELAQQIDYALAAFADIANARPSVQVVDVTGLNPDQAFAAVASIAWR